MGYRVRNLTRNTLLADEGEVASSFWPRLKGLMGVAHFPVGRALQIVPCTSVHCFFMKVAIDVIFLDRELGVLDVVHVMTPWSVSRVYWNAHSVLEVPAGVARATRTERGDRLELVAM